MVKKELVSEENKKEIFYNVVNAGLAGGLVFLGSLTSGDITFKGLCVALLASLVVVLTKFKNYWETEKPEYSKKLLNFIPV